LDGAAPRWDKKYSRRRGKGRLIAKKRGKKGRKFRQKGQIAEGPLPPQERGEGVL